MHRVVNMNSVGIDADTINNYKAEIIDELDTYNKPQIYDMQINTGQNMEGNPTLAVNVDFNVATDGNDFFFFLKQFILDRKVDFIRARLRIHDCYHAEGENLPCQIGDVWELNTDGS